MSRFAYFQIQHRYKGAGSGRDDWTGSALGHLLFADRYSPRSWYNKRTKEADEWRKLIGIAERGRYPTGRGCEDFDVMAKLWRELERIHGDTMVFRIVEVTGEHEVTEIPAKTFTVPVIMQETARTYEQAERLVKATLSGAKIDGKVVEKDAFNLCGRAFRAASGSAYGNHIFVDGNSTCLCGESQWDRF